MEPVAEHEPTREPEQEPAPEPTAPPSDGGLPAPTALESLVNALLEAGPDVAEHVVRAAQELLLAAQAVIDAADRAVEEQQGLRATAEPVDGDANSATVHAIERTE